MLDALAALGTEPPRIWCEARAALGSRLWPLTPEDRFDEGPIPLPSGEVFLADARIDNRDALGAGADIAERSDAQLLAAVWADGGAPALNAVAGDYAFAVWRPDGSLVLGRDPFGRRPLYWMRAQGALFFASLPLALAGRLPRRPPVSRAALARFLSLAPAAPDQSFFEGIRRVPAGAVVEISTAGESTRTFYMRQGHPPVRDPSAQLSALLDAAVTARLRGAGSPVGAHLSAGLDSAAVVSAAAARLAETGGRLVTFTAAPPEGTRGPAGRLSDEWPIAADLARGLPNVEAVRVETPPDAPLLDDEADVALSGQPTLNLCNRRWLEAIDRAARERGVKVLLTGDFGNLAFSDEGLDRLRALRLQGRIWSWLGHSLRMTLAGEAHWPRALIDRLTGAAARRDSEVRAVRPEARAVLAGDEAPDLFERRRLAMTSQDMGAILKSVLARHGIDIRDPLTDRRLVEFCWSLPLSAVLADGRPRGLARRLLRGRVPAAVLAERRRGYQGADWGAAMLAQKDLLAAETRRLAKDPDAVELIAVERLQADAAHMPEGRWHEARVIDQYRLRLLRGLSAGRFLRMAKGANR
jgi:asparagine synthase (glutamine-hydrolysing)